jgi:hypothetical protein
VSECKVDARAYLTIHQPRPQKSDKCCSAYLDLVQSVVYDVISVDVYAN